MLKREIDFTGTFLLEKLNTCFILNRNFLTAPTSNHKTRDIDRIYISYSLSKSCIFDMILFVIKNLKVIPKNTKFFYCRLDVDK